MALLAIFAASAVSVAADGACSPTGVQEHIIVRHVVDGDTVVLGDGRKLRLIGIDTPEIGRKGARSAPLALEARSTLRRLVGDSPRLVLQHGVRSHDRYGRDLGHLFLESGTNLQAWMLQRGLGTHLFVPPESTFTDCYVRAESLARGARLGVWRLQSYQPLAVMQLRGRIFGYRVVKGQVTGLRRSRSAIWLDLGTSFRAQILRQDLPYFTAIPLHRLPGKTVITRGWISGRGHSYRTRLRHASFLEIAP